MAKGKETKKTTKKVKEITKEVAKSAPPRSASLRTALVATAEELNELGFDPEINTGQKEEDIQVLLLQAMALLTMDDELTEETISTLAMVAQGTRPGIFDRDQVEVLQGLGIMEAKEEEQDKEEPEEDEKEEKKQKEQKSRGKISILIKELITTTEKTNKEITEIIREKIPTAKTNAQNVGWYRWKLRKK